jgi:hypothetical protein
MQDIKAHMLTPNGVDTSLQYQQGKSCVISLFLSSLHIPQKLSIFSLLSELGVVLSQSSRAQDTFHFGFTCNLQFDCTAKQQKKNAIDHFLFCLRVFFI